MRYLRSLPLVSSLIVLVLLFSVALLGFSTGRSVEPAPSGVVANKDAARFRSMVRDAAETRGEEERRAWSVEAISVLTGFSPSSKWAESISLARAFGDTNDSQAATLLGDLFHEADKMGAESFSIAGLSSN